MSISFHIEGYREPDTKYVDFKKIYDFCQENKIVVPQEVMDYLFDDDENDDESMLRVNLKLDVHYKEYLDDMEQGFEVELDKLPPTVKKLRFYASF